MPASAPQPANNDPWGAPAAQSQEDPWSTIQPPAAPAARTSPALGGLVGLGAAGGDATLPTDNDPWNPVKAPAARPDAFSAPINNSTSPSNAAFASASKPSNDPWTTTDRGAAAGGAASGAGAQSIDPFSP